MALGLRGTSFADKDTWDRLTEIYNHLILGEHHEHVYPSCDGEGTACAPVSVDTDAEDETHAADTDQYYWGEPVEILPVATITSAFYFIGAYVYANTTTKFLQWHIYPIHSSYSSARNGGNAWDEGATVLTVTDGTLFAVGDLVYITSSANNGEIMRVTDVSTNVVTVERETVQCACTGLWWDHTTDGDTEVMWRCYRDATSWHGFGGEFSAASAKDFVRIDAHMAIGMSANTGLIIRALNASDNLTATAEVKIIYHD